MVDIMASIPGPKINMNLQAKTSVADGMGGFTDTWATVAILKGVFTQIRQQDRRSERLSADKLSTFGYYVFICYIPDAVSVTNKNRLEKDGKEYNILIVRNPGLINNHYEIEVEEIS